MIERFAAYLGNVLIEMGTTREEERPFLVYGLFIIMSDTIQIGLLLIIALLLNTVVEMVLFSFCFGLLKRTIGGWHAGRHITCVVLFTTLAACCVYTGTHVSMPLVMPLTLVCSGIMWVIIWLKAPVEHPNNPQTKERLAELKQISRWLACVEFTAIVIPAVLLHGTSFSRCLLTGAMGAVSASLALIPRLSPAHEKGGDGLE